MLELECGSARVVSGLPAASNVYMLLAEVIRMAAMQGFLGPFSLDFVIIFFICGDFICICAD